MLMLTVGGLFLACPALIGATVVLGMWKRRRLVGRARVMAPSVLDRVESWRRTVPFGHFDSRLVYEVQRSSEVGAELKQLAGSLKWLHKAEVCLAVAWVVLGFLFGSLRRVCPMIWSVALAIGVLGVLGGLAVWIPLLLLQRLAIRRIYKSVQTQYPSVWIKVEEATTGDPLNPPIKALFRPNSSIFATLEGDPEIEAARNRLGRLERGLLVSFLVALISMIVVLVVTTLGPHG